jgi:AraC-like DNA-binding protein
MEIANTSTQLYETHLVIRKYSLPPGKEWLKKKSGWSLIQISSGTGYGLQGQSCVSLEAGAVLLAGNAECRVRASQLNDLALHSFTMMPERLAGLMTQGEQDFFKQSADQPENAFKVFSPSSPVAMKMAELCAGQNLTELSARLAMLQVLIEAFGEELDQVKSTPAADGSEINDAKERLRLFLRETPSDVLLELNFEELAKITHCTTRHLSRIFCDVANMSFRDKRAEIRLDRARELLANSNSKMVHIALESGYKSLSSFNLMFNRQFGISPGRWRQKNIERKRKTIPRNSRASSRRLQTF